MLKKAAISIVLLGAAGAAGYWVYQQESSLAGRLSAAQFLPEETLLFIEAPDLAASGQRWKQTGLAQLIAEPEVKSFLEKPLSRLKKEAPALGVLRSLKAEQAFVALTRIDEKNMPAGVAGFSYKAPRQEVEAVVAEARKRAQEASPLGRSELTKYKEYEIESFTAQDITVAGVFAKDWYFIGNDVELLKETLDRFDAPAGDGRLHQLEAFTKCVGELPRAVEAVGFIHPKLFVEKRLSFALASGAGPAEKDIEEMKKIKGVAGAISFDGALIRETVFTYAPELQRLPELSAFTRNFTSPQTLFYMGSTLPGQEMLEASLSGNPAMQPVVSALAQKGLYLNTLVGAVGSNFGLYGEWPIGSMIPVFSSVLEIKDATKARNALDLLSEGWSTSVKDGVVYKAMPPIPMSLPFSFAPTLALTDNALIASLDRVAVEGLVGKSKAVGETLEESPAFKEALSTVGAPDNQIIYLDTKVAFERFYGTVRPLLQMSGSFLPGVADVVDFGKLPTTEVVARHLRPTIASARFTKDGKVFESAGSLSFQGVGLGAGLGVGIAAAKNPELFQQQGSPDSEEDDKPLTPPAPPAPEASEAAAAPSVSGEATAE